MPTVGIHGCFAAALFHEDDAVGPRRVHGLGDLPPKWASPAATTATCAIRLGALTGAAIRLTTAAANSAAPWTPFFSSTGFTPAAMFLKPSLMMNRANTITVVVPSPVRGVGLRGDLLDQLDAHVLETTFQREIPGDRRTIFGHQGCHVRPLEHRAAAWSAPA